MKTILIQIIASFFGVIGFSIIYNIHGKKLYLIGLGGSICWAVYCILFWFLQDKVVSCLGATLVVAAFAELLARIIKTPVILLLVPMVLPLVPGSDLYYMMLHFVRNDTAAGGKIGYLLLGEAGAIVLGIIIVTSLTQTFLQTMKYLKRKTLRKI